MLKLSESKDIDKILGICDSDLLGTRIACYALAYGFDRDFLQIWFDEETSVAVAKFYDSMTLAGECSSPEEVREFVRMIGFQSLEMSLENCHRLGFKADEVKKSYIFSGNVKDHVADIVGEEHYKELYRLVSKNIPGSFADTKEAYLAFLSDLTFKQRRGLARCRGIISDGRLISSVITSAETQNSALLSAVASDRDFRGKGVGKATVLSTVNELINENKKVFVIALNESAEGFYEHIGFEFNCEIATVQG